MFSSCIKFNLILANAISLFVISSSIALASFKNAILSCVVNFSLSTAFSKSSALSLSALALSTSNCLCILSPLAVASASSDTIAISFLVSSPKFLIPSVASLKLLVIPSTASAAPSASPLNLAPRYLPTFKIAEPKLASISVTLPTTTPICLVIFINLF